MKLLAEVNGSSLEVDLQAESAGLDLKLVEPGVYSVLHEGRSLEFRVIRAPGSNGWLVNGAKVTLRDPRERVKGGAGAGASGKQTVLAPMPGKVVRLLVAEGDAVELDQGVVVVEAMKMQNEMKSPKAGTVVKVLVAEGATVGVGEALVVIE